LATTQAAGAAAAAAAATADAEGHARSPQEKTQGGTILKQHLHHLLKAPAPSQVTTRSTILNSIGTNCKTLD
jgi:hypothetical protein